MRADSCLTRLVASLLRSALTGSAALALLAATPAKAQSGMYGFSSSYALYSGQRGSTAGGGRPSYGGGGTAAGWQPGAGSVYPPTAYAGPRPSVDIGAGASGNGGTARVVGSSAGSRSAPRGTPAPSTYRGGDVVLPPGTIGGGSPVAAPTAPTRTASRSPAAAAGYDVEDYYEEDGPPLPVHRSASGGKGVDPKYNKQLVRYSSTDPAGTIIVDTGARYLYLIQGDGTALRYGIGVGREGFAWSGTQRISNKREWPEWRPPAEMIARRPDLPRVMEGGPENPLGARALYLGSTLYRIHGTNEPETIGQAVSSGCIRMRNEDVTDLYDRVSVGAVVRVI